MFDGWADIPICGKILLSYSTQLPLRYINIIIFTLPSYVLLIIPSISLSLMVTPCYLLMFQIPMLFSSYPKFFLMNSSWKAQHRTRNDVARGHGHELLGARGRDRVQQSFSRFRRLLPLRWMWLHIHVLVGSMDWFKGKSTGNHRFSH